MIMELSDNNVNKKTLPLGNGVSLQLYGLWDETIFESAGKWLYPLFEVEDYLHAMQLSAGELFLHDRIAGRAAASLISRMGFKHCFIDTISTHALDVFVRYGVSCGYNMLVDKIDCRTEDLISSDMDIEEVYRMLRQRAGRLHGIELEITGLIAGYDKKIVIDELNLKMRAGDQMVIIGDNGSGKSTLLKVLIGSVQASGGEIKLGNVPAGRVKKIPSSIGYVNQSINTTGFPVTAEEVVSLGLLGQKLSTSDRTYQIEIAMRRTGCFHLAGRSINTLSGGEKQRVSLARCLAQKAGLILMDEPTSFLDRESKDEFLDVLNHVVRRHMPTVILVSHDHEWVERLGWAVQTLKDGKLC